MKLSFKTTLTSLILTLIINQAAYPLNNNLLKNGNFNNGFNNWELTGVNAEIVEITDFSVNKALKVNSKILSVANNNSKIKYPNITVKKDMVYKLSFNARSDNTCKATIEFKNLPESEYNFEDIKNISITEDWKKHEIIFISTVPEKSEIVFSVNLNNSTGTIYFDDFSFKQKTETWYEGAEYRIDEYRKGNFNIKAEDTSGNPVSDSIIIRQTKHEFPWGTAFDQTDNPAGSTYSTSESITAPADAEIYQTERWSPYFTYELPSEKSKKYNLTIKLAEIWFDEAGSRYFDVHIDGQKEMESLDKFDLAGGKFIAFDTTAVVTAVDSVIRLEFYGTTDNASIMGIVLSEYESGDVLLRLNSGGETLTTQDGNEYINDLGYIDRNVVNPYPTTDDWRKATMRKFCNYGVTGNSFKWSGIEPNEGILNYERFENTINWFQEIGWDFRAHTLLWGAVDQDDHHALPQWVGELPPNEMYEACKMRIEREVIKYKGIVKEYDVINEPIHANWLQSQVGDSINWNSFKWARAVDPNARLFINDYNVVEWQYANDNYIALIERMLEEGAPITGIGSQCHFGTYIDVPVVKQRFDNLAKFDLPILITEFDMAATDMAQIDQAIETAKIMRLAFSHPAIEGFIFWGLFDPAWRASISNLFNADKTPRIVADTVYHLIHEKWNTKIYDKTNADGKYSYSAFYGDYEVLVKFGDAWKKFDISNRKIDEGTTIILSENTAKPTSPELISIRVNAPNIVELTFDKEMRYPSGEHMNFQVFEAADNTIETASLKAGDPYTIVLNMLNSINSRDYIPVTYQPGNQTSVDGGILKHFGPVIDETLTPAYISSKTTTDGKTIKVDFKKPIDDTSVNPSEFTIMANNTNHEISGTTLNATKDTIFIRLSDQIISDGHNITISYSSGSLQTTCGLFFTNIHEKRVENNVVVPRFVSAITENEREISVRFSNPLGDPSSEVSSFQILVNGNVSGIEKCELSTASNRHLFLSLSSSIKEGDDIILSYTPGSLASPEDVPVPPFSETVTNNLITNIFENEKMVVTYYPNPISNKLVIEGVEDYQTLTIANILGQKQIHIDLKNEQNSIEINTSSLNNGVYFVNLSNHKSRYIFKIVKN